MCGDGKESFQQPNRDTQTGSELYGIIIELLGKKREEKPDTTVTEIG
jgi:hypothetical protein